MPRRQTLAATLVLLAALLSLGASARSQNFIVTAATPELAREICLQAEEHRRMIAIEWLDRELPPWSSPCPITVRSGANIGAGGVTTFLFDAAPVGRPVAWTMAVQGSRERILDSVLPHEVTHTIFATHFGRQLPRWADEGACVTSESDEEQRSQQQHLRRFLTTNRGIPINRLFAMREYPRDVLPLYAQGHSLTSYLLQQGGKREFIRFLESGMDRGDWESAARRHYGFRDLAELQAVWLEWVAAGEQ